VLHPEGGGGENAVTTTLTPTGEQQAIVDCYRHGGDLVVEAGAGTGKSSTLRLLGQSDPTRKALYLAFNKVTADDAARTFPRNVTARTAHSLAYRTCAGRFAHRLRAPRLRSTDVAAILADLNPPMYSLALDAGLHRIAVARLATIVITRFQQSADPAPAPQHVPRIAGLSDEQQSIVTAATLGLAGSMWVDLNDTDGELRYSHDTYLKQYALTEPTLPFDVVMLDEAQDTAPVLAALVDQQAHAQRIAVGDTSQSIYGWRGAVDAMTGWPWPRLRLSESFRFGPALAEHANQWLDLLDAGLRLTGRGPYDTTVGYVPEADAVLARGNVGALVAATLERDSGRRVAIVGGTKEIKQLAFAARDLQDGRPTDHPELLGFDSWTAVQEYAEEDADGSDLATFVRLIDRFGHRWALGVADDFAVEKGAEVVVSTAHKAKGREWPRVQIGSDFPKPGDKRPDGSAVEFTREDAMLAYVAVTRAREQLDPGGLAWIAHTRPELVDVRTAA
jgi:hypothetical protein